jgi:excisionase family DNA binding protein
VLLSGEKQHWGYASDLSSRERFGAYPAGVRRTMPSVLTVAEAASRVGRSPETVRRWIRSGRLPARGEGRRRVIDPADLDSVRDELYPMLPLPPEWERLEDGTPAPNWVAAVALSRSGR